MKQEFTLHQRSHLYVLAHIGAPDGLVSVDEEQSHPCDVKQTGSMPPPNLARR